MSINRSRKPVQKYPITTRSRSYEEGDLPDIDLPKPPGPDPEKDIDAIKERLSRKGSGAMSTIRDIEKFNPQSIGNRLKTNLKNDFNRIEIGTVVPKLMQQGSKSVDSTDFNNVSELFAQSIKNPETFHTDNTVEGFNDFQIDNIVGMFVDPSIDVGALDSGKKREFVRDFITNYLKDYIKKEIGNEGSDLSNILQYYHKKLASERRKDPNITKPTNEAAKKKKTGGIGSATLKDRNGVYANINNNNKLYETLKSLTQKPKDINELITSLEKDLLDENSPISQHLRLHHAFTQNEETKSDPTIKLKYSVENLNTGVNKLKDELKAIGLTTSKINRSLNIVDLTKILDSLSLGNIQGPVHRISKLLDKERKVETSIKRIERLAQQGDFDKLRSDAYTLFLNRHQILRVSDINSLVKAAKEGDIEGMNSIFQKARDSSQLESHFPPEVKDKIKPIKESLYDIVKFHNEESIDIPSHLTVEKLMKDFVGEDEEGNLANPIGYSLLSGANAINSVKTISPQEIDIYKKALNKIKNNKKLTDNEANTVYTLGDKVRKTFAYSVADSLNGFDIFDQIKSRYDELKGKEKKTVNEIKEMSVLKEELRNKSGMYISQRVSLKGMIEHITGEKIESDETKLDPKEYFKSLQLEGIDHLLSQVFDETSYTSNNVFRIYDQSNLNFDDPSVLVARDTFMKSLETYYNNTYLTYEIDNGVQTEKPETPHLANNMLYKLVGLARNPKLSVDLYKEDELSGIGSEVMSSLQRRNFDWGGVSNSSSLKWLMRLIENPMEYILKDPVLGKALENNPRGQEKLESLLNPPLTRSRDRRFKDIEKVLFGLIFKGATPEMQETLKGDTFRVSDFSRPFGTSHLLISGHMGAILDQSNLILHHAIMNGLDSDEKTDKKLITDRMSKIKSYWQENILDPFLNSKTKLTLKSTNPEKAYDQLQLKTIYFMKEVNKALKDPNILDEGIVSKNVTKGVASYNIEIKLPGQSNYIELPLSQAQLSKLNNFNKDKAKTLKESEGDIRGVFSSDKIEDTDPIELFFGKASQSFLRSQGISSHILAKNPDKLKLRIDTMEGHSRPAYSLRFGSRRIRVVDNSKLKPEYFKSENIVYNRDISKDNLISLRDVTEGESPTPIARAYQTLLSKKSGTVGIDTISPDKFIKSIQEFTGNKGIDENDSFSTVMKSLYNNPDLKKMYVALFAKNEQRLNQLFSAMSVGMEKTKLDGMKFSDVVNNGKPLTDSVFEALSSNFTDEIKENNTEDYLEQITRLFKEFESFITFFGNFERDNQGRLVGQIPMANYLVDPRVLEEIELSVDGLSVGGDDRDIALSPSNPLLGINGLCEIGKTEDGKPTVNILPNTHDKPENGGKYLEHSFNTFFGFIKDFPNMMTKESSKFPNNPNLADLFDNTQDIQMTDLNTKNLDTSQLSFITMYGNIGREINRIFDQHNIDNQFKELMDNYYKSKPNSTNQRLALLSLSKLIDHTYATVEETFNNTIQQTMKDPWAASGGNIQKALAIVLHIMSLEGSKDYQIPKDSKFYEELKKFYGEDGRVNAEYAMMFSDDRDVLPLNRLIPPEKLTEGTEFLEDMETDSKYFFLHSSIKNMLNTNFTEMIEPLDVMRELASSQKRDYSILSPSDTSYPTMDKVFAKTKDKESGKAFVITGGVSNKVGDGDTSIKKSPKDYHTSNAYGASASSQGYLLTTLSTLKRSDRIGAAYLDSIEKYFGTSQFVKEVTPEGEYIYNPSAEYGRLRKEYATPLATRRPKDFDIKKAANVVEQFSQSFSLDLDDSEVDIAAKSIEKLLNKDFSLDANETEILRRFLGGSQKLVDILHKVKVTKEKPNYRNNFRRAISDALSLVASHKANPGARSVYHSVATHANHVEKEGDPVKTDLSWLMVRGNPYSLDAWHIEQKDVGIRMGTHATTNFKAIRDFKQLLGGYGILSQNPGKSEANIKSLIDAGDYIDYDSLLDFSNPALLRMLAKSFLKDSKPFRKFLEDNRGRISLKDTSTIKKTQVFRNPITNKIVTHNDLNMENTTQQVLDFMESYAQQLAKHPNNERLHLDFALFLQEYVMNIGYFKT